MRRIRHLARVHGVDALIALLAAEAMVEVALTHGDPDGPTVTLWFALTALAVMVAPLFARRRLPFVAPSAYWLIAAGLSFVDGRLVSSPSGVFVLGMGASFLLGNQRDALTARIGLLVVLVGAALVVYNVPDRSATEQLFIPLVFVVSWLAGLAVRGQAEQAQEAQERATAAERARETSARLAVAEERARIARELHDVVAHSVSVMVLQVGAVRHRLPETLSDDKEALRGVEQVGRAALEEMRRLLGAMRHDDQEPELTPQPGLEDLDSLAREVGRAGLPVEVHREGDAFPLPRAIELSAYRIIQEGLTNALKHAGASRADVTVRYDAGALGIEVRDDGHGAAGADGVGHGLVGIRERVKIYGGDMSAGSAPEGGFVLRTRLPLGGGS